MQLNPVVDQQINDIMHVFADVYGIIIDAYDEQFLQKSLDKRICANRFKSIDEYGRFVTTHREEAVSFASSLLVTYSEFFRNSLSFALLEQLVLPQIVEQKITDHSPEIRIWSAGCAAGQEAYSVAMLLDEILAGRNKPVRYRIFATDVNMPELERARSGVYNSYAVTNMKLRQRDLYFTRTGDSCAIVQRIKDCVEFLHYDLLDESTSTPPAAIFGDFDLVLCSNVLLYYRPEKQQIIMNKLRNAMSPSGYLVSDETARTVIDNAGGFRAVAPPAMVYRRAALKV